MLGVIGGMGPLATSLFYDMVTEKTCAKCDQDNINMLILSDAAMPDRTAAILSGDTETVRQRMLADARFLEKNGCEAIAVTCNTAHYFVDMIEEEVGIPFIHMIRETAKALSEQFAGKRVAVLATDGTIQTGLYQKALEQQNVKAYAPERNIQAAVMETIYGRIKQNKPADPELWQRIERKATMWIPWRSWPKGAWSALPRPESGPGTGCGRAGKPAQEGQENRLRKAWEKTEKKLKNTVDISEDLGYNTSSVQQ